MAPPSVRPPAPPSTFIPGKPAGGFGSAGTGYQNVPSPESQTIKTQMEADRKKQEMVRWQILQDTQNKTFEIQEDITRNKAKTQDRMFNKWDEYIRD